MARGWESKAIEAQQAEAAEASLPRKPALTPEDKAKLQKKEGLLLDRKRVLHQLQGTPNEHYRSMLKQALVELDSRLADLG